MKKVSLCGMNISHVADEDTKVAFFPHERLLHIERESGEKLTISLRELKAILSEADRISKEYRTT